METKHVFRVVLASPSDTKAERDEMPRVIEKINQMLRGASLPVLVELWKWETDAYPGLHLEGPQGQIEESLPFEDADAVVGLFHRRIGTPVPDAESGTVHEIRKAIKAWKEKGSPQVMVYFNEETGPVPDEKQFEKVKAFKAELVSQANPKDNALVWPYNGFGQFAGLVEGHLWRRVFRVAGEIVSKKNTLPVRFSFEASMFRIRAEGLSELLGDLMLTCTCNDGANGRWPLYFDVFLYLNTTITSRSVGEGLASRSDVILFESAAPSLSNLVCGMKLGANCVLFKGIRIESMKTGETRQFRISGVHANANGLGRGDQGRPAHITTSITLTGAKVENETQLVAVIETGLEFEVRSADASQKMQDPILLPQSAKLSLQKIATLRFAEGFAGAFKERVSMAGSYNPAASSTIADSVQVYSSESSLLNSAVPGPGKQMTFAGLADHGTGLVAQFNGLPSGIQLFVSAAAESYRGGLRGRFLDDASSTVDSGSILVGDVELRELFIHHGATRAAWEVIGFNRMSVPTYLDVSIYVTYEGNPRINSPTLGTATINGSFGPCSTNTTSNPLSPIPRFADTSRAINFLRILGRWPDRSE